MATNDERIAWLAKRVDYLEHRDKYGNPARDQPGPSGYWTAGVTKENWPDTCPAAQSCPDCADKTIFEYIDEMIEREKAP